MAGVGLAGVRRFADLARAANAAALTAYLMLITVVALSGLTLTVAARSMEPLIDDGALLVEAEPVPCLQEGTVVTVRPVGYPDVMTLRVWRTDVHGEGERACSYVLTPQGGPDEAVLAAADGALRGVVVHQVPWLGLPIRWLATSLPVQIGAVLVTLLLGLVAPDRERPDGTRMRRR